MPRLISPTGKPIPLAPVRPNVGIQVAYQRKIDALVDAMHRDVTREILRAYKSKPPVMAQDDSPAAAMANLLRGLGAKWLARFDKAAPEMASYFATAANKRSDATLRSILKRAGFTVKFTMTRAANDTYRATIAENVGLIKSIASEYLTQVEGHVMRSVQAGRDLGPLATALEDQFGVTKRRAALIARDQNNKATAVITRVRQQELGITQARWLHSAGGKHPRPSHVKASKDRVVYDVAKGWFDPDAQEWIRPGELINCRCVARAVVPGFS